MIELRPEVRAFAEAMELKLRKNDHKGGWKEESVRGFLFKRVQEETSELNFALKDWSNAIQMVQHGDAGIKLVEIQAKKVLSEAVDVANFCRMIADNAGTLK